MPRSLSFVLWLYFTVGFWIPTAQAQQSSKEHVKALGSIGMTVSDVDRAADFYSKALAFEKVSDVELAGSEYERLTGVFGLRIRVVHMKLG
ncbi:MAG: glyoxalase, partial [Candidatus Binatia bacterium]